MKPEPPNKAEELLQQAVRRTLGEIDAFKQASRLLPLQIEEELADFIRETERLLKGGASREEANPGDRELKIRKLSLPGLRQAITQALPPVSIRRSVFSPGYPNRLKLKKTKSPRRAVKSRKKKSKAKRQIRFVPVDQPKRASRLAADRPQSHTGAIRERQQTAGPISGERVQTSRELRINSENRRSDKAGEQAVKASISYVGRSGLAHGTEREKPSPASIAAVGAKWTHPDLSGTPRWPPDGKSDRTLPSAATIHTSANLRFRSD